MHIPFGLFFSLTIVSIIRGASMYAAAWRAAEAPERKSYPGLAVAERVSRIAASERVS